MAFCGPCVIDKNYKDAVEGSASTLVSFEYWPSMKAVFMVLSYAFLAWSIIFRLTRNQMQYWPIFFTHWCLVATCLYFTFSLIETLLVFRMFKRTKSADQTLKELGYSCIDTLVRILFAMSLAPSFMIVVAFWIAVFEPKDLGDTHYMALMVAIHGITSLLIFIDGFLNARWGRIKDVVWPLLFGGIFVIFTVIYHAVGGTNHTGNRYIYSIMDWSKPGPAAAYSVAIALGSVVVHTIYAVMKNCILNCRKEDIGTKLPVEMAEFISV